MESAKDTSAYSNDESVVEQIDHMLRQEINYRCSDYLAHERKDQANQVVELCASLVTDQLTKSPSSVCVKDMELEETPSKDPSTERPSFGFWRQQMFDWSCMVTDSFGMDRHCVAASMDLLDRYVSHELARVDAPPVTRDDFQLFSMTCLYIAVKIMEPYPRKITVGALVDMSRGFYSEEDVVVTEREILSALGWFVHGPTALSYVRLFGELHAEQGGDEMSTTLTELALSDPSFCSFSNGIVGLACSCLALRLSGQDTSILMGKVGHLMDTSEFNAVYSHLEQLYKN